jgi:hypothetical protein
VRPSVRTGITTIRARRRYAADDALRHRPHQCIFCGFCEESCPVDWIVETRSSKSRREARRPLLHEGNAAAVGDRYEAQIARDREEDAVSMNTQAVLSTFSRRSPCSRRCASSPPATWCTRHLARAQFFTAAAHWLMLRAEFAIALVPVYVGAVMVLFLFVVMMLDVNRQPAHAVPQLRARRRHGVCAGAARDGVR